VTPSVADERFPRWPAGIDTNLADLGGLPLVRGGLTAYRRVYRSARRESLTRDGWRALKAAGVTTVIDLRHAPERGRTAVDPPVEASEMAGVRIVEAPTEVPDDPEFRAVCGPWLAHPHSYPDILRLFPGLFGRVFQTLADAPGGVLVHCAGGRDRTGLVTAVLLSLTGVVTEAIVDDYARACRSADEYLATSTPGAAPLSNERLLGEAGIRERATTLHEWLDGFDAAGYLATAGLTATSVAALAARLR